MRLVNYKARNMNGQIFQTTSYKEATECENRIIETYFTPIDERTDKEKIANKNHVHKMQEIFKVKRV